MRYSAPCLRAGPPHEGAGRARSRTPAKPPFSPRCQARTSAGPAPDRRAGSSASSSRRASRRAPAPRPRCAIQAASRGCSHTRQARRSRAGAPCHRGSPQNAGVSSARCARSWAAASSSRCSGGSRQVWLNPVSVPSPSPANRARVGVLPRGARHQSRRDRAAARNRPARQKGGAQQGIERLGEAPGSDAAWRSAQQAGHVGGAAGLLRPVDHRRRHVSWPVPAIRRHPAPGCSPRRASAPRPPRRRPRRRHAAPCRIG